jgi:uncharacterized membrane protein
MTAGELRGSPAVVSAVVAALAAAGVYLLSRWRDIPAPFPVRWDSETHEPTAFAQRTPASVLGGLLCALAAVVAMQLAIRTLAGWSRRRGEGSPERAAFESVARRICGRSTVYWQIFVGAHAVVLALSPLSRKADAIWDLTIPLLIFGAFLPIIPIVWRFTRMTLVEAGAPKRERWWPVYFDPADPNLSVIGPGEQRSINFGNAWNVVILGFPMLVLLAALGAHACRG